MQKVKLTEMAAEKELDVATDRKKKCKEVLHMSSERLKNGTTWRHSPVHSSIAFTHCH